MFCSTFLSLFFLQLWLAQLAFAAPAAPISAESIDNSWQYGTGGGILGFVVLILDIIVFGVSPAPSYDLPEPNSL